MSAPVPPSSPDEAVPVEARAPRAMTQATAKQRLTALLVEHRGHNFCDACSARAIGSDPSTAYRAAAKTMQATGFVREYAICSDCGASRLITRATG